MSYFRFPKYVSVDEKKAKAKRKLKQLQKKNSNIQPVVIEGSQLTTTWWGKSWNQNLTKYADYSNRVGRGRSYLRHGAVLDLKINEGKVNALVQGSRSQPYSVSISIDKIVENKWKTIKKECEGKIESLQELLQGKFPKALAQLFTSKEQGLFPSPKEINFSCSCPDWAYMCKHVAAVLFGIGTRLDEDPMLFFKLRGVEVEDLVAQAVKDNTNKLLEKAKKKSSKVIDDINISDVFGIQLDTYPMPDMPDKQPKKTKKNVAPSKKPKKTQKQITQKNQKPSPKTQSSKIKIKSKATPKKALSGSQEIALVFKTIKQNPKGIDIPSLQKKTGIDNKQRLYNIVYTLVKSNLIKRISRGIYQ